MNSSEKYEMLRLPSVHVKLVVIGICVNVFLFLFNVNSYFTLTRVNVRSKKYETYLEAKSDCNQENEHRTKEMKIDPKTDKPFEIDIESVASEEKAAEEDIIEEWEQQKEDKNIFYSIFDDVEQWPPYQRSPDNIERRILIHINSRNILSEVASDVRMMHRQVQRVLHIKLPDYQFDLKFWVQSVWPSEENIFKDCEYTRKSPLKGLNYIYGNDDYDAHIFIQNHLNFVNPNTIKPTIEYLMSSKPGKVVCLFGHTNKYCKNDMMAFTTMTGKHLYKYYVNRPKFSQKIMDQYNHPSMTFSYALSSFVRSLTDVKMIQFHLVRKEAGFYTPKISKVYQTFTAHPISRSVPSYMRTKLSPKWVYNFNFLNQTVPCHGAGFVTLIKTSRSNVFRRQQMRKLYSKLQPEKYQKSFNVYFLLGQGDTNEDEQIEKEIQNEIKEHRDIVLYDRIDKYDSLPDKTFAGYQFFAEKCQQRDYVIFHDDDVFIAVNELKSQLKKTSSDTAEVFCLKGRCIPETAPNYLGKYFLWVDTFPHDYYVPRYSNGQCTGLTRAAANQIYDVAKQTDRRDFRIEDMLFTGIFRERAKVTKITELGQPVCEHFQNMKPLSREFEWLTANYQKGKLFIQPQS